MTDISVLSIDIAKSVFQLCGIDAKGKVFFFLQSIVELCTVKKLNCFLK